MSKDYQIEPAFAWQCPICYDFMFDGSYHESKKSTECPKCKMIHLINYEPIMTAKELRESPREIPESEQE